MGEVIAGVARGVAGHQHLTWLAGGTAAPLPPEVRWLLVGAIAVVLVSIALRMRTIKVAPEHRPVYRPAGRVLFLSSTIIVLLGFTNLSTIPLLVVLTALMLAPVFYGFKTWLQLLGAEASALP